MGECKSHLPPRGKHIVHSLWIEYRPVEGFLFSDGPLDAKGAEGMRIGHQKVQDILQNDVSFQNDGSFGDQQISENENSY